MINLSSKGNNLMGPRFKVSLERHSLSGGGGGIINIQNDTNTVRQVGSKYVVFIPLSGCAINKQCHKGLVFFLYVPLLTVSLLRKQHNPT